MKLTPVEIEVIQQLRNINEGKTKEFKLKNKDSGWEVNFYESKS